jgi:MinD-like ATPase involved in chromosome partitioning or flagellar assembly
MKTIRFDDSLGALVHTIEQALGEEVVRQGRVLRDTSGQLSFFSATEIGAERIDEVSKQLLAIGPYIRADRPLADINGFGVSGILEEPALSVEVGSFRIKLLDRRLVGADWLRLPARLVSQPPRFVFASLKGGVGRTTALSVTAAHLAANGNRVLAIDMDMEAPGLGAILLDEGTLPEFGLIDALVEGKFGELDDAFLVDLVGPSALADHHGRIDILPAFGRRCIDNPADVLAKIARAYAEKIRPSGEPASMLDQVRDLVDSFSLTGKYDVILVDARAGLHETTAAAILGLGAHVFLFGLNEPQTFQGYAALLSHLNRVKPPNEPANEWLNWLTMVQGKAPVNSASMAAFTENCTTLFTKSGLVNALNAASKVVQLPAAPFNNVPWDDDVPDDVVTCEIERAKIDVTYVLDDERFRLFDPISRRDLLTRNAYLEAYSALLVRVDAALDIASNGDGN